MILRSELRAIALAQRETLLALPKGIPREDLAAIQLDTHHAVIISGVRRCGKSTFLRQLAGRVENFHYFNFEDTRLLNFDANDFTRLDDVLGELQPACDWYFFDEVQNVPGWEVFVRSRLDAGKHFTITGSNASMLSKDLGTRLTGRHVRHELFPFSYNEMLQFTEQVPGPASFEHYLRDGGFPEYIKTTRIDALQQLFQDIITRDIITRHKIRATKQLIEIALYLISNTGNEFSYTSLKNSFSLGSTNTAIEFISHLEDSYLLLTVPRFNFSIKKQLVAPKKGYAIDTGIARANSLSYSSDLGRALENAVFLQLKRQHKDVLSYKEKQECDFIVRDRGTIVGAIQACLKLSDENQQREIGGLIAALEAFNLDHGTIVTLIDADELTMAGKSISVVPAWKWFSGQAQIPRPDAI
jgi:predicted AAA+ superfamily ATPase